MSETTDLKIVEKIEHGLNILNHILIAIVSIFLSCVFYDVGLSKIATHAWLCGIGYNLVMAVGMMSFYKRNYITDSITLKIAMHSYLMTLGGIMRVIGMTVIHFDKNKRNEQHYVTTHSILGLVATILSIIACITGSSALFMQKLMKFLGPLWRMIIHIFLGYTGFFIGMLALFYGYEQDFFLERVDKNIAKIVKAFTLISLLLSSIGPLRSFYFKLSTIWSQSDSLINLD